MFNPIPKLLSIKIECLGDCPSPSCVRNQDNPPRLFQVRVVKSSTSVSNSSAEDVEGGGGGGVGGGGGSGAGVKTFEDDNSKTKLPFRFAQLLNGTVDKVFFAKGDDDEQILNFKRTIVGAFQVQCTLNNSFAGSSLTDGPTDGPTDQPTDQRTDTLSYRVVADD